MTEAQPVPINIRDHLPDESDESLKAIIADASTLLDQRDRERKKQAIAEIKAIAAQHGLKVEPRTPSAKRGRPRKTKQGE